MGSENPTIDDNKATNIIKLTNINCRLDKVRSKRFIRPG